MAIEQRFRTVLTTGRSQHVFVPLPFDPDVAWGTRPQHHVHGTVNGLDVRGVLERLGDGHGLILGPAWIRGCGLTTGDAVEVVLQHEGPQRGDLAEDLAAALAAVPAAATCWDSIAQYYRRAYLRYIDATKRRPDRRQARIAEVVELLAAGVKDRPKPSDSP